LGDKFPTIDKFKECLTNYALANGLSLWFDRSSKQKDVAKRGQRNEIIKDPSDAAIHDHYGLLRSYAKALADSNEGMTVKVGVIVNPYEKTYFDRLVIPLEMAKSYLEAALEHSGTQQVEIEVKKSG
ncbi:hypothetical protein Tco_1246273, partial [Tanacetum coccineum]